MPFSPFDVYARELTVLGSYAATYGTYEDAIALIASGRVRVESTISAVRPLEQAAEAVGASGTDPGVIKLQIRP